MKWIKNRIIERYQGFKKLVNNKEYKIRFGNFYILVKKLLNLVIIMNNKRWRAIQIFAKRNFNEFKVRR